MVPAFFKISLQRFLCLIGAYAATRVLFLIWNWPMFHKDGWLGIGQAFLWGMRIDTAAIFWTNGILFALWMLPTRWFANRVLATVDWLAFAAINLLMLGMNVADSEFVKFIGKRTSYDLLFIRDDVEQQSVSILTSYWYFVLGLLALTALLVFISPRFPKSSRREGWISGFLWRFATVALIVIGIRGFGFKPLGPMDAYFSTHRELGLLSLNTPFNIIKTRPSGAIQSARYFATDREAILRLKDMTDMTRPPLGILKGWNVVVIIVESFAAEYTGIYNTYPGYTPFFDSLARKSIWFKHSFSNARRSIEGIPAVFCGIPNMMDEPIVTGDFSSDRLDCLAKVLGQHGYSTYWLHGAHNGSMHFDSFSPIAGFENFIGENEFPYKDPANSDGYWGILDEPMLQYATEVIDRAPKPVFLGLFTLSSHHPYFIPPQYRGRFPKGTLEIHESIGYADYALQQFFRTASTKPWFDHTIFVITADHTQKSDHKEYQNIYGSYRVPILFYIPGLQPDKLKVDGERIVQQIDIQPSILDLLGIEQPDRLLVGQSAFDLGKPGRAYNYTVFGYWYLDPKVYLDFGRPPLPLRTYVHTNTWDLQERPSSDAMFAEPLLNLKAVVHYMNTGLIGNSLYKWRDKL